MDETEARVRCLELAERLSVPDRAVQTVVEIASVMYAFVQASPQSEPIADSVDKPRRGRPPKTASIME